MTDIQQHVLKVTPTPKGKRTRKRMITSCSECNRRKQKCNRERPCNHCLHRHAPSLCHYEFQAPSLEPKRRAKPQEKNNLHALPENSLLDHSTRESYVNGEGLVDRFATSDLESVSDDSYSSNVLSILVNDMGFSPSSEEQIENTQRTTSSQPRVETPLKRRNIRELFPQRSVIDFLIKFYLQEMNWLYELIHAPTFSKRYKSWWSQTEYTNYDDIQFGILILRMCCSSAMFLPHAEHPTKDIIDTPLAALAQRCHDAADILDNSHPKKSSCTRIQQLLEKVSCEKTNARVKESWFVLNDAIGLAQDLGLHLEKASVQFTPVDIEMRRRLFWNLYLWDRFMVIFLGKWPLIPDKYCSVGIPRDDYVTTLNFEGGPTNYSDQVLQFKLTQLVNSIQVPEWETQRENPRAVSEAMQLLKHTFLNFLPPAFKLLDPDTSWDSSIPDLPRKREYLNLSIYGIIAGIHRAFLWPSQPTDSDIRPKDIDLIEEHQRTLMTACCSVIHTVKKLHKLLGGGPSRYFCLATGIIEGGAVLGMSLIAASKKMCPPTHQRNSLIASSDIKDGYTTYLEGLNLLGLLAEESIIAKRGLKVLRNLHAKLQDIFDAQLDVHSEILSNTAGNSPHSRSNTNDSVGYTLDTSQPFSPFSDTLQDTQCSQIPASTSAELLNRNSTLSPDWSSFADLASPSWIFDDTFFHDDLFNFQV